MNIWPLHWSEVWRLRIYQSEKCVAAAKPLYYLCGDLDLPKEECRRIVWELSSGPMVARSVSGWPSQSFWGTLCTAQGWVVTSQRQVWLVFWPNYWRFDFIIYGLTMIHSCAQYQTISNQWICNPIFCMSLYWFQIRNIKKHVCKSLDVMRRKWLEHSAPPRNPSHQCPHGKEKPMTNVSMASHSQSACLARSIFKSPAAVGLQICLGFER